MSATRQAPSTATRAASATAASSRAATTTSTNATALPPQVVVAPPPKGGMFTAPAVAAATPTTVGELLPESRGHTMHVVVERVNMLIERVRPDGTRARVGEALVGDATGCILWTFSGPASATAGVSGAGSGTLGAALLSGGGGGSGVGGGGSGLVVDSSSGGATSVVDLVQRGAALTLVGAEVTMFKGHMRLAVSRWGSVSPSTPAVAAAHVARSHGGSAVNLRNNLSDAEWDLREVGDEGEALDAEAWLGAN